LLLLCLTFFSLFYCNEEYARLLFRSWKETHKKVYLDEVEENVRFQNFMKTLEEIEQQNEHHKVHGEGATFGVNKFSDLTNEEFKRMYLQSQKFPSPKPVREIDSVKLGQAQLNVDWRKSGYVTPVKNQRQCGSCWAFAAVEAVETAYLMGGQTITPLSTQQAVSCVTMFNSDGCQGGFPEDALKYSKVWGLVTDKDYPYVAKDTNCSIPSGAKSYKIASYSKYAAQFRKTEQNIYTKYASAGPVIVHNLDVAGWKNYRSGVLTPAQCKPERAYHAPQIVGWNLVPPNNYWIIRNTWGADWGENGYIRMLYGNNTCGMDGVWTLQASI